MFTLTFISLFVSTFYSPVFCVNHKIISKKAHDYGPYYITTRSVDICKPSKPFDEENKAVNVSLKVIKVSRTEEDYRGNYTLPNDVKITGSLILSENQQNGGVFLIDVRRKINKPCENLFFAYILNSIMKTDPNCVIKKGTYKIENVQPNMIAHKVFNDFHYNTYRVTLEFYGVKGTVSCVQIICEIKPLRGKT